MSRFSLKIFLLGLFAAFGIFSGNIHIQGSNVNAGTINVRNDFDVSGNRIQESLAGLSRDTANANDTADSKKASDSLNKFLEWRETNIKAGLNNSLDLADMYVKGVVGFTAAGSVVVVVDEAMLYGVDDGRFLTDAGILGGLQVGKILVKNAAGRIAKIITPEELSGTGKVVVNTAGDVKVAAGKAADAASTAAESGASKAGTKIGGAVDTKFTQGIVTGASDAAKAFEIKISQQALSTGQKGEQIAADMLKQNGWTNFQYIKNASDNGIDIIARGPDGQLGFFEVKTTAVGKVPNLSTRQSDMTSFVAEVLTDAANAQGRYKGVDSATQKAAQKILEELRTQPANISATAIGVDLKAGIIRVSPWPKGGK